MSTHGQHIVVEVAWCPACHADCTVEIVTLEGDPGPVAVCVECGLGVETWWTSGVLATAGNGAEGGPGAARAS